MPVIERANVIAGAQFREGPPTGQGPSAGGPVTASAIWDFAVHGGAISTIGILAFQGLGLLPLNSIIRSALISVLTIPVGAGASIAVQIQSANDIQAAAAITGAPWSTLGVKSALTGGTIQLTAPRDISIVISGAPLTAGRIQFLIDYIPGS